MSFQKGFTKELIFEPLQAEMTKSRKWVTEVKREEMKDTLGELDARKAIAPDGVLEVLKECRQVMWTDL